MVSTYYGVTVRMLQHTGLIPQKVYINDKNNYKTVTHLFAPLRIHSIETVRVLMPAIQKPATGKFLRRAYRPVNTCYYSWCDQHNTCCPGG